MILKRHESVWATFSLLLLIHPFAFVTFMNCHAGSDSGGKGMRGSDMVVVWLQGDK